MRKIADNTTATQRVIDAYNKKGYVTLYPCYENTCDEVDMIYIDNGSEELFTTNISKRNSDTNVVVLTEGEMKLASGMFLEFIEMEEAIEVTEEVREQIKKAIAEKASLYTVSGMSTRKHRSRMVNEVAEALSTTTGLSKKDLLHVVGGMA